MISGLQNINNTVNSSFGHLNTEQLNWKPAAAKWSIAQCLDHLIVSNELYFGSFDELAKGVYKNGTWQKINPFTNVMGNMLYKMVASPQSKVKAPPVFQPSASFLSTILDRFRTSQRKLEALVIQIENKKLGDKVISSPLNPLITLKVKTALDIILAHENRHINQAINVMNMAGFPQ